MPKYCKTISSITGTFSRYLYFNGTFINLPYRKTFMFFNISNYRIAKERILPPICYGDLVQYCYICKSDIFPTLEITFTNSPYTEQNESNILYEGKFGCNIILDKDINLHICNEKKFSEKEKFEYMINYGVDLDKVEFMSYMDFMEKFFEKLAEKGN